MLKTLNCGAIGVSAPDLERSVNAARLGGFPTLEVGAREILAHGASSALTILGEIIPTSFGIPFDWRRDPETWSEGLRTLSVEAKAMAELGVTRACTYVLPMSDERPYMDNRKFHVERLKPIAEVLGEHGIRFGLEFIGAKTLRDSGKYPFICTLEGMIELGWALGPNAGILLDAFHWYTSHGTLDDLRRLRPEQVVNVHVNDAPSGIAVDEQQDHDRRLPGDTGVIDLSGFLRVLAEIGYDGPVVCEPFSQELRDLPSDEARLHRVSKAMDRMFAQAASQ